MTSFTEEKIADGTEVFYKVMKLPSVRLFKYLWLIAPFRGTFYFRFQKLKSIPIRRIGNYPELREGYHFCKTLASAKHILNEYCLPTSSPKEYAIFKCSIPKGTKYFVDSDQYPWDMKLGIAEKIKIKFKKIK